MSMSNEELVKLIRQGVNSTPNMEQLYINNKGYIHKIAMKYAGYADIEDLMQEAYFGLYEAVKRYEDTHETKFMTYAGFWIQQSIRRYIENNNSSIRIPVHLQGLMYQYHKIINAFHTQLGRKPTDRELCHYLNISQTRLEKLKGYIFTAGKVKSLDETIPGGEGDDVTYADTVASGQDLEDEVIDRMMEQDKKNLWQIVERNANEIENQVIRFRYIKSLTLEAAGQELGITREAVRQWESKALRKLRRPRCSREIKDRFDIAESLAYRGGVNRFKTTWTSSTERAAIYLNDRNCMEV